MLAVFTYYVESDGEAYIIDPTYDYLIYRDYVAKRGATLKYVVLTHYHADFVAGHTEFNVPIVMGPNSKREISKFQVIEIPDNGKFKIGKAETRVISTPGHTLESACFILAN
jgi:hydroxyacylglutathione hydrolase